MGRKVIGIELGPTGQLAKVTAIDEQDGCVHFDLRNGNTGSFVGEAHDFVVGDVLLIFEEGDETAARKVPLETWPEALWIGVVKLKETDITVIDSGFRPRVVPTREEPSYEVGNTVQAGDVQGVTRVLSTTPISSIELPKLDDSVVEQFRRKPSGDHLTFDDFGGLPHVVERAKELIETQLRDKEALTAIGVRPIKGVLFTGPPGTGKTMLARIIANSCDAEFFQISGPEIFSKWYGESEEVLRRLFAVAEESAKTEGRGAIIFFDEIDSVAAQRDDSAHEASKRVVGQLLTLMDGADSNANVIVIAATNRPRDLDSALRRPGRFDWEIEFTHPNEHEREEILRRTARPLGTIEPLPHRDIAARTQEWSAAELAGIFREAGLLAAKDKRHAIAEEDYVGGFERAATSRKRKSARQGQIIRE